MKLRRLMRNRPSMTLHEPQVPLPKIADLSVGRGDLVGVDFFLTGCGIQSLYLWGFCNGLRLFFFGHSQDCFLLTCQE